MESEEPTTDIISAARRYRMFQAGDKVLVAVSGGPDSVAMLHALHTNSSELEITLHIAHINHGIRGEQSNLDEDFVRNLAHSLKLPIMVERVDVPVTRSEMKMGVEEAARVLRHKFLRETAAKSGMNKIAVGHTADDRAESVMLNIIRGCGIDGLASIKPTNGNIVRPLIDTTRKQVEVYIAEHSLPYRIDESNEDTTYSRNKVRHDLLPWIEREFNTDAKSALVRLAEIASAQSELIEDMAQSARREIGWEESLDAILLIRLPEALQYEVIRREILRIKGDLLDITFDQTQGIVDALHAGGDFQITLPPGDIYATRREKTFWVWRREEIESIEPFGVILAVPGTTHLANADLILSCSVIDSPTAGQQPKNEAIIDAASIVGALRARSIRLGDRIVPFGMTGSKKLQDVFVDKKIPQQDRARAVVVCDDEKILWVVGVVSSELAKVLPTSRAALHLTAVPDQ